MSAFRTGHEIRDAIASRKIKAVEVTEAALLAITSLEASLKAYITLVPERALAAARAIDARIERGEDPGLLAGVPVAVTATALPHVALQLEG